MIGMDVHVGSGEIEKLLGMLHVSKEACRRASKRAVRKVAKWTQATAAKTMSAEMRLQQRIMRARLRMYMRGDGMEQKVWLGLNSLAARRLGVPKRQGTGTKVGAHFFDGAFPIWKFGGGVYRRTTSERFPLELAKLEIDEAGAKALQDASRRAEARLLEILRQELNYEFQKSMGRAK